MADPNCVDTAVVRQISERKQAIWLLIGTLNEAMNDPNRALEAYETCLTHNGSNVEGLMKAGILHMKKESLRTSIAYLDRAVRLDPDNGSAWGALAYSYVMAEDFDKAYQAYYTAFAKMPEQRDPSFWFGVGILYDRIGMLDHGLSAYNAVLNLSPSYDRMDEVLYSIGLIHKEKGDHELAYQYMAKIISLNSAASAQAEACYQVGTLHDITGNLKSASEAYHNALSRNQNHIKAIQGLAWLNHKSGNDHEAVEMLQRALRIDDGNAETYYLIGRIYMANNEFRVAYDNYQLAVHLDPKNAYFWCSIASLYYQRGQYRDAMDAYSRAVQIYADIPEVWYDLGTLYELYSQFDDAADSYRRALQMQPQNSLASHRLQLVQNALLNGPAPAKPTGKPACDGPDISPTTRLGQRPHVKSNAPTQYGPLPAPPGPSNVSQPATSIGHYQIGQQPLVPTTSALHEDRHLRTAEVAKGVPDSFPSDPGYSSRSKVLEHDGQVANTSNVTVVGPDGNRESSFTQGPGRGSMPLVSRPMLPAPTPMENRLHKADNASPAMTGSRQVPEAIPAGAQNSHSIPLPPSRTGSQAHLSPTVRNPPRSSPDKSASAYSGADRSTTSAADNLDPLSRRGEDWKSRNGKERADFRNASSAEGPERNGRITANEQHGMVNVSSVETRSDGYPHHANSAPAAGGADRIADRNLTPGATQGIPTPSSSLAQTPSHFSRVGDGPRPLSRFSNGGHPNSLPGITRLSGGPHENDALVQSGTPSVASKPELTRTAAEKPPSMRSSSPVVNDEASAATAAGEQASNRKMQPKSDIRKNLSDGEQAQSGARHTTPPAHGGQYPSSSGAKEDSPVDEGMLPRLRPLPTPSSRPANHGRGSEPPNGDHFIDKVKGTKVQGNAEINHSSKPPPTLGSDSGQQLLGTRGPPDAAGLRSQSDPSRQAPPGSELSRSPNVPRSGFTAVVQEPNTSQSRLFKTSSFPEFKGSRAAGISFTKPQRSIHQDETLQKTNHMTRPNGDADNRGKMGSPVANISRESAEAPSPRGLGGSDDMLERGQRFAVPQLPSKTPEGNGGPSSRASPEHKDGSRQSPRQTGGLISNNNPSIQTPYSVGSSREKLEKSQPHRNVAPTGIRSSLTAVSTGLPMKTKRTVFRREEDKKGGDGSDQDVPGESQDKIPRVSSRRNPFGSGISPSFSRPAPRTTLGGGLGVSSVKEPVVHDPNPRQDSSESLKMKTGAEDLNGSRQEGSRGQMMKLGKRSASCLENGGLRAGEGSELKRFLPKSAVIGPSIENRMRPSDVEIQEPRFIGSSSQYAAGRSASQESKRDKSGEPIGNKRFSSGEL
eukprot:GFKZ01009488.1.p1 GENE.GFKZ01009488.1~~GFKZ01009488.1.p1  ORF type:complete len:1336 (+),score=158.89 GFKZ01009488.1:562-4569(+)